MDVSDCQPGPRVGARIQGLGSCVRISRTTFSSGAHLSRYASCKKRTRSEAFTGTLRKNQSYLRGRVQNGAPSEEHDDVVEHKVWRFILVRLPLDHRQGKRGQVEHATPVEASVRITSAFKYTLCLPPLIRLNIWLHCVCRGALIGPRILSWRYRRGGSCS